MTPPTPAAFAFPIRWARHGTEHAWPDPSSLLPMPGETSEAWLGRFARALVQELSGPVLVEIDPSVDWTALDAEFHHAPSLLPASRVTWRDWLGLDAWSAAELSPRIRQERDGGRLGAAERSWRRLRQGAARIFSRAIPAQGPSFGKLYSLMVSSQRGNARRAAIEAGQLLWDGPWGPQARALEFGWSAFSLHSRATPRAAFELCSTAMAWISADRREAFLSPWLRALPALLGPMEERHGASLSSDSWRTVNLFRKLVGESTIAKAHHGWGRPSAASSLWQYPAKIEGIEFDDNIRFWINFESSRLLDLWHGLRAAPAAAPRVDKSAFFAALPLRFWTQQEIRPSLAKDALAAFEEMMEIMFAHPPALHAALLAKGMAEHKTLASALMAHGLNARGGGGPMAMAALRSLAQRPEWDRVALPTLADALGSSVRAHPALDAYFAGASLEASLPEPALAPELHAAQRTHRL